MKERMICYLRAGLTVGLAASAVIATWRLVGSVRDGDWLKASVWAAGVALFGWALTRDARNLRRYGFHGNWDQQEGDGT